MTALGVAAVVVIVGWIDPVPCMTLFYNLLLLCMEAGGVTVTQMRQQEVHILLYHNGCAGSIRSKRQEPVNFLYQVTEQREELSLCMQSGQIFNISCEE